jgi:hypothetical protein
MGRMQKGKVGEPTTIKPLIGEGWKGFGEARLASEIKGLVV